MAHSGAERQLLHGSGAVLRYPPAVFLLKRASVHGTGPARSAD